MAKISTPPTSVSIILRTTAPFRSILYSSMKTKTCPKCGPKPIEEFNWRNKAKGIRCNECRECHSAYNKAHYKANKEYYVKKAGKRNHTVRRETRRKLYDYLLAHPCSCGEVDPRVLDFDHDNPKEKSFDVSRMLGYSWDLVLAEIKKCTVRCSNCHRRRTSIQQNWYPWLDSNQRLPASEAGTLVR